MCEYVKCSMQYTWWSNKIKTISWNAMRRAHTHTQTNRRSFIKNTMTIYILPETQIYAFFDIIKFKKTSSLIVPAVIGFWFAFRFGCLLWFPFSGATIANSKDEKSNNMKVLKNLNNNKRNNVDPPIYPHIVSTMQNRKIIYMKNKTNLHKLWYKEKELLNDHACTLRLHGTHTHTA